MSKSEVALHPWQSPYYPLYMNIIYPMTFANFLPNSRGNRLSGFNYCYPIGQSSCHHFTSLVTSQPYGWAVLGSGVHPRTNPFPLSSDTCLAQTPWGGPVDGAVKATRGGDRVTHLANLSCQVPNEHQQTEFLIRSLRKLMDSLCTIKFNPTPIIPPPVSTLRGSIMVPKCKSR